MAARVVHRPARTRVDPLPRKALEIPSVPTLETETNPQEGAFLRLAMPLAAGSGMLLMMVSSGSVLRMLAGAGFVLVAVLMGVSMYVRSKTGNRKRLELLRRGYLRFLKRVAAEVADEIELQRAVQVRLHPAPSGLLDVIADPARVYERRRFDADFGVVRVGTGAAPLARAVVFEPSRDPAAEPDAISAAHADRTRRLLTRIDNVPLTLPLSGVVSVVGSVEDCHAVLRAALTQLMALHAPEDVVVHVCVGVEEQRWRWLRFAPHLLDAHAFDGPTHRRRVSHSQDELVDVLGGTVRERAQELAKVSAVAPQVPSPFVVIVVDAGDSNGQQPFAVFPPGVAPEQVGVCVVQLSRRRIDEPSEISIRAEVADNGQLVVESPYPDSDRDEDPNDRAARARRLIVGASRGSLDRVDEATAATIARELAPIRLAPESAPDAPLESTITIETLLGIDDVETFSPTDLWRHRAVSDFLRVPFGVDTDGTRVYLDLKESALEGHGPHGLCIGATGSGKSEVLRTLVLAQAINHPPERVSFVLVDYKGGAAFNGLDILPHTAAIVDNLSDQDGLVDRLHDALSGEMQRRQRVLQDAQAKNIYDYNDRRDAGAVLDPLPNLLVIIDEFGEILVHKPEFLDLFVQIGRIGRSIGVHLLLASQRLEEGRLRGLESHLSYRLGLRTFSAMESKTVIGTADAHTLPALPGSGYLKVDPDVYTRFKAAYVSGRYEPSDERINVELPPMPIGYELANTAGPWLAQVQAGYAQEVSGGASATTATPFDRITLEVAATRLSGAARKVTQIWLPPLTEDLPIDEVLGPIDMHPHRGLCAARPGPLSLPIGIVDDPARQWQGPFVIDTAAANLVIVGAPQTGKSTTARALVISAALTHTPDETWWYLIDAAGTTLADLADLPHVGDVATRFDADKVRRTVAELATELARREALFAHHRIATAADMRAQAAAGQLPAIGGVDRYLLIDGWATFATQFDDLTDTVTDLAVRGLGYGMHVIIIANRVADMRTNLHTNLAITIEHRFTNAIDSLIDRNLQKRITDTQRGRVLTADKKLAQISNTAPAHTRALIDSISQGWAGPTAAPVRMLPDRITYPEIIAQTPNTPGVIVGVDESTLSPVSIDLLHTEPHILVFGDTESGKTTLLRTLMGDLITRHDPESINLVVVDPRRALLDFAPQPPLKVYMNTVDRAQVVFDQLHDYLAKRLPGADVTPEQLRNRSWWSGPEMIVIVDDYDLLVPSSTSQNPIAAIAPLIAHARDVGLHLIVTRRAAGSGRALFDPVVGGIRDNAGVAVLLSGDRGEGQIFPRIYFDIDPPGRGRLIRRGNTITRTQFADWPAETASPPAGRDVSADDVPPE